MTQSKQRYSYVELVGATPMLRLQFAIWSALLGIVVLVVVTKGWGWGNQTGTPGSPVGAAVLLVAGNWLIFLWELFSSWGKDSSGVLLEVGKSRDRAKPAVEFRRQTLGLVWQGFHLILVSTKTASGVSVCRVKSNGDFKRVVEEFEES